MFLIQILLPLVTGDTRVDNSKFTETRRELLEKFEGVTAYLRASAQGAWTAPDGHVERDEVVMVEVVTEAFDRDWWRTYAETLARRFDQASSHIRAIAAEMP